MTAGTDDVPGVLVPLDPGHVVEALAVLDAIEGVGTGLFERARITTRDGAACWVYRGPGPTAGFSSVRGA